MSNEKSLEMKERIYKLVLILIRLIQKIPNDNVSRILVNQITRSSTSIIANYVEGQSGVSRKEFTNFIAISLKSANETNLWLTMMKDLGYVTSSKYEEVIPELNAISNILGASVKKLRASKLN